MQVYWVGSTAEMQPDLFTDRSAEQSNTTTTDQSQHDITLQDFHSMIRQKDHILCNNSRNVRDFTPGF
jgi:hypothetical protein